MGDRIALDLPVRSSRAAVLAGRPVASAAAGVVSLAVGRARSGHRVVGVVAGLALALVAALRVLPLLLRLDGQH